MNQLKSIKSLGVCLALTAGLLAGCGDSTSSTSNTNSSSADQTKTNDNTTASGTNDTPAPSNATPAKNLTLSVMASQDHIMDAEVELAKQFEKETGIKIDYQIVPADQFQTLIGAKLNAGEGPDIIVAQSGKLTLQSTLDPEKNLEDLSAEPWVSTIKKPFEESVSYKGKVYGLPLWDLGGSNSWVFVYNKKIFTEQGLTPPKTFDGLLDVSAKLLAKGITPIYEPVSDGWHHPLPLMEMGPQVNKLSGGNLYDQLNSNQTTVSANPNILKLLQQIKTLVDKGYYGKDFYSNTYANAYTAMASGKYGMMIDRSNFGQELVASVKDSKYAAEDFGAFVMPFLDNQTLNVNPQGPSKFVYKGGKHVAEAKQFLAYLADPKNLQTFLDKTSRFSELPFQGLQAKANPVLDEIRANSNGEEGTVLQAGVSYIDPQWMDIGKDLTAYFTGKMKPEDILKNMDKRREQQAKAQKDPAWSK